MLENVESRTKMYNVHHTNISIARDIGYLHTTSSLPSPCTDEKFGASADISHLYIPLEFNAKLRKDTLVLSELSSCWGNKMGTLINN